MAALPKISPDYPFDSHTIEVLGSRMHYIDQGSGDPILSPRGNSTWSYVWRNISSPGFILPAPLVSWCQQNLKNLTTVDLYGSQGEIYIATTRSARTPR